MRRFWRITFPYLAGIRKYSYPAEFRMERKKSPNTPQEAEIQCGVPHLCGVLGLFFRIGATSTLRKTMRSSAGCGIPHGANFRILRSSASCGIQYIDPCFRTRTVFLSWPFEYFDTAIWKFDILGLVVYCKTCNLRVVGPNPCGTHFFSTPQSLLKFFNLFN